MRKGLVCLSLFVGFLTVASADMDSATLLSKMRSAYEGVKSAKFHVIGKGFSPASKEQISDFEYKAAKKVRAEVVGLFDEKSKIVFTANGDKFSARDESGKLPATTFDFEQFQPAGNLETLCFWDWKKQLSTEEGGNMQKSKLSVTQHEKWNDKDWIVLEENASEQKVKCRYFVDPKTFFIWRTISTPDSGEHVTDSWITKLDTGIEIDDKDFKS